MTALSDLLGRFRTSGVTNRERGTYFEELTVLYLRTEPAYRDLYRAVSTYSD
jgi:predicted helicase